LTLSVVIRCHNHERFLTDSVGSALAQTRPPDEIVVVDDGSEPPVAVHGPLASVRLVRNEVALGPAEAANTGMRKAQGNLLVLLDADDRLSARYLELLERSLDVTEVDFAYAASHLFGAVHRQEPLREFDPGELARENFVNVSAMFRRSLLDRIGGFDPMLDSVGYEDWDFWLRAVGAGAVGTPVEGCWLEYRRHDHGSRNTSSRRSVLAAHVLMRRRHPALVRRRDVGHWLVRATRRTITGKSIR
jgi:GT2 family glycosyltransferase